MNLIKSIFSIAVLTFATICGVSVSLAQQNENMKTFAFAPQSEIRFAAPWQLSAVKYTNAQELVVMSTAEPSTKGKGVEQMAEHPIARVLITTETRSNHEDALKRLESIAASRDATAEFVEIGGWPAVEVRFAESLPRRGAQATANDIVVQRTITAIAQGDKVVIFDSSVLPDAPPVLLKSAKEITRSVRFAKPGNPGAVKKALEMMRSREKERLLLPKRPQSLAPGLELPAESAVSEAAIGTPVRVQTGVGELEVAVSADATNVVIASNSGLSFSTNRGASFSAGTTGVFGLNDPSLARGASGNFYLDVIAFPTGTVAQLNATGCTNAANRSTNNGASFALQGYSAQCPQTGAGICFPDQEHIAADSVNQAGGNDQIYAVWRNFTPASPAATCRNIGSGFVTASITCSQNNGTTWTAAAAIPGAGDLPRIAVGRDGAVYVVSISGNSVLLNRFTSCANGLTAEAGFPVTVATLSGGVACPVPGLDRCNDGNTLSSPTVAPDPANANHLFVSFAENNGGTSERIVSMESTNRGASFPTRRNVSNSASVRRFMPWSCTTRGSAWIGWYDRGAATGTNNDLTDYFLGSTSGTLRNLTVNPDPQCASGWPCAPRSSNDSEACSVQPQQAGSCLNAAGGGSGTRCDFSAGGCPPGEACRTGGGCPKYGDYNGIACAGDFVVTAWSSATAPPGPPAATGIGVYSSAVFVARDGAAIWRYTGIPCSGNSCPGWQRFDNNPRTVAIVADAGELYQLHNNGGIWQSTHGACDADSCPGWRALDNNQKTVAIAAGGGKLYQLHDDGMIWRYTGTPCSGASCPGWQRLDNNSKTVAIAASGANLYQMHNDGMIWRFTGTPCSGNSCPGWQKLDNNSKTTAIAADGGALYQLHNDGMIWRYTGTPCSGNSCPGWQKLDNNTKTTAIAAAGNALYQLHNDGMIWRYTGTPCSGNSCPGWQRLDNNFKTVAIAAAGNRLYQLHDDGMIWRYTGTPCSGNSCPGWQRLDNNPRTGMIAAGDELYQLHVDPLYQLHNDGMIWRYTGQECAGDFCPGWERLDNNPKTQNITGADGQLFQLHDDGRIWRYTGAPCSGNNCPGWQMLDNNPKTVAIASAGTQLFQLHNDGMIWRWNGTACSGNSCPGWQRLDNNPKTVSIVTSENQLFQLHNDGRIWRYTGTPCSGNSCPGWQQLDNNPRTKGIAAGRNQLFQLHNDGRIWRYTGKPCSGNSCPGWQQLDNNPKTTAIAAGGNQLVQLHNDGRIWRSTGTPCSGNSCPGWQQLDNNGKTQEIVVSGSHIYQRHNNGQIWRFTGPACSGNNCPGWRRLDNNPKTRRIAVGGFNS